MASIGTATLYDPSMRDQTYKSNVAKYLVDLHDSNATFDFCGGMMFQFRLTSKLRERLASVAEVGEGSEGQPIVFDASNSRMFQTPGYDKSPSADNVRYFHGREIRQVPNAAGGRGFVLELSDSEDDAEGWSEGEISGYDGWGHDSGRHWRKVGDWEKEGVKNVRENYGHEAFGLNHRFYLHYDSSNHFWLSAEDG
eukprot:CAMPEP_0118642058 /NCGR_PEP_ID=MMETSP0785-20121206/5638_1 /TAXON_ID=91992 /ORGANISM="Bolidomonas pacifica, Strain CCMP 1866" /LENGTH=195 /DNA_ID=CAMNT_0006533595 /DNA_START=98 /DNA_END=681 /DNA_ORIENTATION=+